MKSSSCQRGVPGESVGMKMIVLLLGLGPVGLGVLPLGAEGW